MKKAISSMDKMDLDPRSAIEQEFEVRRQRILERRQRHLDMGRFFVDVCCETEKEIRKLWKWKVAKLAELQ